MKKLALLLISLFLNAVSFGQIEIWPEDSLKEYEGNVVPIYTADYMKKYNRMKRLVVKVYPYALYAADVIDNIDSNAEKIDKRRKQNKFYRQAYQGLKDDFKYFILDLYTSEGKMLMKLIHRETGMTVYDISNKYRGKSKAEMFNLMAKIWDQDLTIQYDPTTEDDKIVEHVIRDIQSGTIAFDDAVVTVDKITFKEQRKIEKKQIKANKKKRRERKKMNRKRERQKKRAERKKNKQ